MKACKTLLMIALTAAAAVSCGRSARVRCTVDGAPGEEITVKLLDVNVYKVLDTVKTDASGTFACKVPVQEAQPEFVYFFRGDTKIASAVVLPGDRVRIQADTLGHYDVEGSQESVLLKQVEESYADFVSRMTRAAGGTSDPDELNKELSLMYIAYYREAVKYVLGHPRSITAVPVFFQQLSEGSPVFSQNTDALLMSGVADSLATVYPDSKYVKALRREADKRGNVLSIATGLRSAKELGYPDLTLPDIKGRKVTLSEVDAKVVLLHFWTAADNDQKLLNNDLFKPLYEQYHDRGMEIYAVGIDADKPLWAGTVRNQQLPWINVCDGLGAASPAVRYYALSDLPTTFVIVDGEITTENVSDAASLRRLLDKLLK